MSFTLFRFVLSLTLCFTIGLLALRVQTVDDADLRALLLPPAGCPAPCFMNVRPGETDGNTALDSITRHQWVVNKPVYIQPINDINTHYIMWEWSSAQPARVDTVWQGLMLVHKKQVTAMTVRTTLSMGEVWLFLGGTEKGFIVPATSRPERDLTVIMVFPAESLLARITLPKQASMMAFWTAAVELESASPQSIDYFSQYVLPHWCSLRCAP